MTVVIEIPKIKQDDKKETFVANSDLSGALYKAVAIVAGQAGGGRLLVDLPTSQGQQCVGILMNAPTAGQKADVSVAPADAPGIAGTTFNGGTALMAKTDGTLITATAGNFVIGVAKQASLAVNHVVALMLKDYKI